MTTEQALRAARVLWLVTISMFFLGLVCFLFGPRLELLFMRPEWRDRADLIVLRSEWTGRAISLFVISAVSGVAGVVCSIKAAGLER